MQIRAKYALQVESRWARVQVREVGRKVAQPPDPVTRLAVPPLVPHGPRRRSMSEESGRARRSAEQEREIRHG